MAEMFSKTSDLSRRSHSSGAEGSPQGYFPLTAGRAGQQQICKIHAGDQQNAPDGSEEYEQLCSHVADQVFLQGNQTQSPSGRRRVVGRILLA